MFEANKLMELIEWTRQDEIRLDRARQGYKGLGLD